MFRANQSLFGQVIQRDFQQIDSLAVVEGLQALDHLRAPALAIATLQDQGRDGIQSVSFFVAGIVNEGFAVGKGVNNELMEFFGHFHGPAQF